VPSNTAKQSEAQNTVLPASERLETTGRIYFRTQPPGAEQTVVVMLELRKTELVEEVWGAKVQADGQDGDCVEGGADAERDGEAARAGEWIKNGAIISIAF
jgi:hypothetical protein